jgi:hypothetical protein
MGNILQHVKRVLVHFTFATRPYVSLGTTDASTEAPFLLDIIDDLCPEDECVVLDFGQVMPTPPYIVPDIPPSEEPCIPSQEIQPDISLNEKPCIPSYEIQPDTNKSEIDYSVRPLVLKSQKPPSIDIDVINAPLSKSPVLNSQIFPKIDPVIVNDALSKPLLHA